MSRARRSSHDSQGQGFAGEPREFMPAKAAIKRLRVKGIKGGLVRPKWFRPFPTEKLQKSLSNVGSVAVIDRDFAYGSPFYGGVLYSEIRSTLYSTPKKPTITNFIAGLGGREITTSDVIEMVDLTLKEKKAGRDGYVKWMGVRE